MQKMNSNHRRHKLAVAVLAAAATFAAPLASADRGGHRGNNFQWVGTFDVMAGNGSGVAEIIDVTRNNRQLVYTDAEKQQIGFVDIRFPWKPRGQGVVDVGGEPTSLVIKDPYVLVGVNTSATFTEPSG